MNPVQSPQYTNTSNNVPTNSQQQFNAHVQANSAQVLPTSGIHTLGNHSLTMTQNVNQLAATPQQTSVLPLQPPLPISMNSGYQCSQNVTSNRSTSARTSRDQSYKDSLEALRRNLIMTLGSDPSNCQVQRAGNLNRINQSNFNTLQTPPVINIIMDAATRNAWNPLQDFMSSIPVPVNPGTASHGCFNSTSFNPIAHTSPLPYNPMLCTQDFHMSGLWSASGNGPWGPSRNPVIHPYYNVLWDPYLNLPWDPYMIRPYMPFWPMPWDPTWKTS